MKWGRSGDRSVRKTSPLLPCALALCRARHDGWNGDGGSTYVCTVQSQTIIRNVLSPGSFYPLPLFEFRYLSYCNIFGPGAVWLRSYTVTVLYNTVERQGFAAIVTSWRGAQRGLAYHLLLSLAFGRMSGRRMRRTTEGDEDC